MDNNNYVRKIDIMSMIRYIIRNCLIILAVGIIVAGYYGSKQLVIYRAVKANYENNKNFEEIEKKNASFVVYVRELSDASSTEKVMDAVAMIKNYDILNQVISEEELDIEYSELKSHVYITTVGASMAEIAVDLTGFSYSQEKVLDITRRIQDLSVEFMNSIAEDAYVTVIENTHPGIMYYEAALEQDSQGFGDLSEEKTRVFIQAFKGGVLGVFGMVIVMAVVFLCSTVLRTKEDIMSCYGLAIIGEISARKDNKEELKRIRTFVTGNGEETVQVVNIVATAEKERPNDVAAGLAASLAVNEHKAVVLYTDKVTADKGIYEYVTGKSELKDIIRTSENKRLDVIVRGNGEEEGCDVFEHERFAELLTNLKEQYDYIVISSPELRSSADGIVISKHCDRTVVAAALETAKEKDVLKSAALLRMNKIDCAGIVITAK